MIRALETADPLQLRKAVFACLHIAVVVGMDRQKFVRTNFQSGDR